VNSCAGYYFAMSIANTQRRYDIPIDQMTDDIFIAAMIPIIIVIIIIVVIVVFITQILLMRDPHMLFAILEKFPQYVLLPHRLMPYPDSVSVFPT
jgi:hypothetical protein